MHLAQSERVSGNNIELPLAYGQEGFRTVGDSVYMGKLALEPQVDAVVEDWAERGARLGLISPGDVATLAELAEDGRARYGENNGLVVPEFAQVKAQLMQWCAPLSLQRALLTAEASILGCVGARFHHDGESFEKSVFCLVWLSDESGLDLVLPNIGQRIPLERGTVALIDSGQVHGVIPRNAQTWVASDYWRQDREPQFLLSFSLGIEAPAVAERMGFTLKVAEDTQKFWGPGPRLFGSARGDVDDATGAWLW